MKAVVTLIGEYESFKRMVNETVAGSTTMQREFTGLSVSASKSAEAQVKASALRISRMREEIAAVQAVSTAYKRGSDEQIAAMTLVARKQEQLNRLTGASAVGAFTRSGGGSARHTEREASGVTRGLLAGGGIEHVGLAALSGGAFFGAFLAGDAGRRTIEAATEAASVEKQLGVAITHAGENAEEAMPKIKRWAEEQARFGVSADTAKLGLARLVELTGSTQKAMEGYTAALEISKATGKDFNAVSLAVGKALNGQTTALARYIGKIPKGITDTQLLADVSSKYGGQAAAATTQQQKFSAELANSEVIIGTALLPTVNRLLGDGAKWLDQMNQSGKLQRDVNTAVHDAGVFVHILQDGLHVLVGTIKIADDVTGSFEHTLELLVGLKLASWAVGAASRFAAVGGSAAVAEGEVAALQTSLLGLSGMTIAPIAITLLVDEVINGKHGLLSRGATAGSKAVAGALGISTSSDGQAPTYEQYVKASQHHDAAYQLIENYMKKTGITDPRMLPGGPLAPRLSATQGAGPHGASGLPSSTNPAGPHADGSPSASTTAAAAYHLSRVAALNLALSKNPNDPAAITAKITYDKQAAAFAEKRIKEGRGSASLVDQLSKVYADMNGLQSQLASLSKKSVDAETKSAKQRTDDAKKAQKALTDSIQRQRQLFDEAKQTALGVLGPLGGGPVLTGPAAQFVQQYGGHLSGKAYLQDITQQNKAARGELTNLNTLRRRGAPTDLINNILGQGTAGQGIAQALAHATPAVLKAFLGQYKERQQTAIQLAKMQVATMHVAKLIVDKAPARSDAHDRPTTNKFGRVPNAGRRR